MLTMAEKEQTQKERLLERFREAGLRGLTGAEMQRVCGVFWRLRLRELRDAGYVFNEIPSRYARGGGRPVFRWTLCVEPREPAAEGDEPALFEPPAPPPASAVTGEADTC